MAGLPSSERLDIVAFGSLDDATLVESSVKENARLYRRVVALAAVRWTLSDS